MWVRAWVTAGLGEGCHTSGKTYFRKFANVVKLSYIIAKLLVFRLSLDYIAPPFIINKLSINY
jgi:hypothetical protein